MTDPTQPYEPVPAFLDGGESASVLAADIRRALRRSRQIRALRLLAIVLYLALCVPVAILQPGVLFIPALILFAALVAGIIHRIQVAKKHRH